MARRRPKHLYRSERDRGAELRDFERRYGAEQGRLVYGEVVGKVAREEAEASPGGVKVEHIPSHISFSSHGQREVVEAHEARIYAHRHSRGEHGGRCTAACRRGSVAHRHVRGRRRRG